MRLLSRFRGLSSGELTADCSLAHSLKDAEWVEKKADALKKTLRGATGTANLRDKALKEEYVRLLPLFGPRCAPPRTGH